MLATVPGNVSPGKAATLIWAGWFRWRDDPHDLLVNTLTYATFPLVSGLAFHQAVVGEQHTRDFRPYGQADAFAGDGPAPALVERVARPAQVIHDDDRLDLRVQACVDWPGELEHSPQLFFNEA